MTPTTWRDGEPADDIRDRLSIRPIVVGDALTETLRVVAGRVLDPDLHIGRVVRSAEASGHDWVDLHDALEHALAGPIEAARSRENAAVRVFVFASSPGGRPEVLVQLDPYDPPTLDEYRRGVHLGLSTVVHPCNGRYGKTTSRHWAETAQRLALRDGYDGAILCDGAGSVIESTHSTILWRVDGSWRTTPEEAGGLASTTLQAMERRGLDVGRELVDLDALTAADAVVTVSALRLAVGVRAIGDTELHEPDAAAAPLRALVLG